MQQIDYNKVMVAHFRTKLPIMLWGSSGYGKTSIVRAFAKRHNLDLQILHAQYIDPLALFIPSTHEMKELGYVRYYPSDFLYKIFNAKAKTVLFLDELTRAREDTLQMLTEMLLDRRIFGHKIPDHVMMIAASNFPDEDTGVKDMPDAVMQRLTHLIHAPEQKESLAHFSNQLAQEALVRAPGILQSPGAQNIYGLLRACPRQIDACGMLAEAGLSGNDLLAVCRGRIGMTAGTDLAFTLERIRAGKEGKIPTELDETTFPKVAHFEESGGLTEVVALLRKAAQDPNKCKMVADYLLRHARPETCRSMLQFRFSFVYNEPPVDRYGSYFQWRNPETKRVEALAKTPAPWNWFAAKIGKMVSQ
jgi:hypothetical protein